MRCAHPGVGFSDWEYPLESRLFGSNFRVSSIKKRAARRPPFVVENTGYSVIPAVFSSIAVVKDLGRSSAYPSARSQVMLVSTPRARPTPNRTV